MGSNRTNHSQGRKLQELGETPASLNTKGNKMEITYKYHENNYTYGQPGFVPAVTKTFNGTISKKADDMGYFTLKNKTERTEVHWMDLVNPRPIDPDMKWTMS